jgi:hypothetical protein
MEVDPFLDDDNATNIGWFLAALYEEGEMSSEGLQLVANQ